MHYKLGQGCVTNWGSFVSLQVGANVVTNWSCYYKLRQPLLQNNHYKLGKNIKNWGRYFKLGWLLQIEE